MSDSHNGVLPDGSTVVTAGPVVQQTVNTQEQTEQQSVLTSADKTAFATREVQRNQNRSNSTSRVSDSVSLQFNLRVMRQDGVSAAAQSFDPFEQPRELMNDPFGMEAIRLAEERFNDRYKVLRPEEPGIRRKYQQDQGIVTSEPDDAYAADIVHIQDESFLRQYLDTELSLFVTSRDINELSLRRQWIDHLDIYDRIPEKDDVYEYRNQVFEKLLQGQELDDFKASVKADGELTGKSFLIIHNSANKDALLDIIKFCECTKYYKLFYNAREDVLVDNIGQYDGVEGKSGYTHQGKAPLSYPRQTFNNCYCCSFAAIYNWFSHDRIPLNQKEVRGYSPDYLMPEDLKRLTNEFADSADEDQGKVMLYADPESTEFGNLFAVSDVLFDKTKGRGRKDLAVHSMRFDFLKATDKVRDNMLLAMKRKFHEVLSGGQLISVLRKGHYLTVIGLEGDDVYYLNSQSDTPDQVEKNSLEFVLTNYEKGGKFTETEINWISGASPLQKDALMHDYDTLRVDENGQMSRAGRTYLENDVAHRHSMVFKKNPTLLDKTEGFKDLTGYISECIALPVDLFVSGASVAATASMSAPSPGAAPQAKAQKPAQPTGAAPQAKAQRPNQTSKPAPSAVNLAAAARRTSTQPPQSSESKEASKPTVKAQKPAPSPEPAPQANAQKPAEEGDLWEGFENNPLYVQDDEPQFDDEPQVVDKPLFDDSDDVELDRRIKERNQRITDASLAKVKHFNDTAAGAFDKKNEEDRKENEKKKKKLLVLPQNEDVFAFDRDMDVDEKLTSQARQNEMAKKRSALHKKNERKTKLEATVADWISKRDGKNTELPDTVKKSLSEEDLNALKAFFIGDKEADASLAVLMGQNLLDENYKPGENLQMVGPIAEEARAKGMKIMIDRVLSLSTTEIDFSNDDALIKSIPKLEQIHFVLDSYQHFAQKYSNALVRIEGEDGADKLLGDLHTKLTELIAVCEYYDARKELITNPDYVNHFDKEIGIICSTRGSNRVGIDDWQKNISKQIIRFRKAAMNLPKVLGDKSKGKVIEKKHDDAEERYRHQSMDLAIETMEMYHNGCGIKRLVDLAHFQGQLDAHETTGHSFEYRAFQIYFAELVKKVQYIAGKDTVDGKDMTPEDLAALRRYYDNTVKYIDDYLNSKNKYFHSKRLFERFGILRSLRMILADDLEKLMSVNAYEEHSLFAVLEGKPVVADDATKKTELVAVINYTLGITGQSAILQKFGSKVPPDIELELDIDKAVAEYIIGESDAIDLINDYSGIIGERIAYTISTTRPNDLYYMLGNLVSEDKKIEIRDRFTALQEKINDVLYKGKKNNLQIVKREDMTDFVHENKSSLWRVPLEEQSVQIINPGGKTLKELSKDKKKNAQFMARLNSDADDFDDLIGSLFNEDYGSALDIIYIDGQKARLALKGLTQPITGHAVECDPKLSLNPEGLKEKAAKALIIEYVLSNDHQITIANRQKNHDGLMETVLTDLNFTVLKGGIVQEKTKKIEKARETRTTRFNAIRKELSDKRVKERQEMVKKTLNDARFSNLSQVTSDVVKSFLQQDDKGRSDAFISVKRSLFELFKSEAPAQAGQPAEEPLIIQIERGKINWTAENYAKYSRVMGALTHYVGEKFVDIFTGVDTVWLQAAYQFRIKLSKIAEKTLSRNRVPLPKVDNASENEKEFAIENVNEMVPYYRKYTRQVGEDPIATDDEKLLRRWNLLKNVERDILIFEKELGQEATDDQYFIIAEYHAIRTQIMLRNRMEAYGLAVKKTNERTEYIRERISKDKREAANSKHSEDGFSQEQLVGLRQIDHWVLRNFRNGGYMSMGQNVSDRTDILDRLMAMSQRQRMYIYYLVENADPIEEQGYENIVSSQTEYIPDVTNFNDKMESSKAKFYARFSGGYMYWNKLTAAMHICEGNGEALDYLDGYYSDKNVQKQKDAAQIDDSISNPEEADAIRENLKDLYKVLDGFTEMRDLLLRAKNSADQKDKDDLTKQADDKRKDMVAELERLSQRQKDLVKASGMDDLDGKDGGNHVGGVSDFIKQYASYAGYISQADTLTTGLLKALSWLEAESKSELGLSSFDKTLGVVSSSIGLVFGFISLQKNWASTRDSDRADVFGKSFISLAKSAKTLAGIAKAAGDASLAAEIIAGPVGSTLMTVVDVTYTGIKIGMNECRIADRKSAVKICKKAAAEEKAAILNGKRIEVDRYRDGLVRLDAIIKEKERAESIAKATGSTIGVASTAILIAAAAGAPVTGGASLALGVGGLGITVGSKVIESQLQKNMRYEVVSSFYDVESMLEVAKKEWRKEHDDEEMSATQTEALRERVLYRLAAELGYYSPSQLAEELAVGYGDYLISGLSSNGEHKLMCTRMVNGLGLRITIDPKTKAVISPKASDIAAKLCR